ICGSDNVAGSGGATGTMRSAPNAPNTCGKPPFATTFLKSPNQIRTCEGTARSTAVNTREPLTSRATPGNGDCTSELPMNQATSNTATADTTAPPAESTARACRQCSC